MGFLKDIGSWLGSNALGLLGFGSGVAQQRQNINLMREQNEFNASQASINRNFQAQQAQLARDYQTEFYEQYQSPGAMVRQYQDAGLNPALMTGGYSSGSPVSSSSPSGSMAAGGSAPYQSIDSMVNMVAQMAMIKSEIDKNKSIAEMNRASAQGTYSNIEVNNATIENLTVQNKKMLNDIENNNKSVAAQVNLINGQLSKIAQDNKVSQKQIEQMDAAIKQMAHQNALSDQQKLTLAAQQTLFEFQAEESYFRQNEILSIVRLNNAQAGLIPLREWEQKFKNKYLSLFGSYPKAQDVKESNWITSKYPRKFKDL